jgi:hypothetical protein
MIYPVPLKNEEVLTDLMVDLSLKMGLPENTVSFFQLELS